MSVSVHRRESPAARNLLVLVRLWNEFVGEGRESRIVGKWRAHFLKALLERLCDEPRSGALRKVGDSSSRIRSVISRILHKGWFAGTRRSGYR
jgi:hypothetical protein